jgi:hypothetical protein
MQATCLTVLPEAATLFLRGNWRLAASYADQSRGLAGRLFFCALNAPYLMQLIKASQRSFQTQLQNFVNKPL